MADPSRLESIDLREVWKHEAIDFTTWMSRGENLARLSEAVGIELAVLERESAVGAFSADLLCKNSATDESVIIENQLEKTDHKHLGQLITYAAGLGAKTIIWVAREFRNEHLQAVNWLNENTKESISILAVAVKAWRIGASVAAEFEVVHRSSSDRSAPRSTNPPPGRRVTMSQPLTAGSAKALYLDYWTAFSQFIETRETKFRVIKPQPKCYCNFPKSTRSTWLSICISLQKQCIDIRQVIGGDDRLRYLEHFMKDKAAIEAGIGQPLNSLLKKPLDTDGMILESNGRRAVRHSRTRSIHGI